MHMGGISIFFPDEYLDSAYEIDFEDYYQKGMRGVIFDIDNTLVPHGAPADEKAVRLFARLRQLGFESVLLSNNKEPRVKPFGERVGSRYIHKAGKPGIKSYRKAMELMRTDCSNTLFIGDQIFTDIIGANRSKMFSILVNPIAKKDIWITKCKRPLEEWIIKSYVKKQKKKEE